MGRFLSTTIEFEGQLQRIDDLISRARYNAQTHLSYALDIIMHLQDHAFQFHDNDLNEECRKLMMFVHSPSPYPIHCNKQHAGDENNRPKLLVNAPTELPYDNTLDGIFDERVNGQAVKKQLDKMAFTKSSRVYWFVVYQVLLHLKWLKESCTNKAFLEWVNQQYQCGWTEKQHLSFRDVDAAMRNTDVSLWNTLNNNSTYTKGDTYYHFAVLLRNTFEIVIMNGMELKEPVKDFTSGTNRDRTEFMKVPGQLINWGK